MSLYPATANSVNTYFTHLMLLVGPKAGLDVARRMGISNAPAPGDKSYSEWAVCSLVLGSKEVAPLDMASAFGVLANNGVRCPAFSIARIDAPGKKLFERRPDCRRVIEPRIASTVTAMLRGVVTGGTGTAAQIPGIRVAGKTGTAETGVSHRNTTWFICFAPAEQPRVAVAVVLENQTGAGGTTAAPIAKTILQALLPANANT
jgi:peptidoglycan glycosyltransferase